jgi:hypothetical protein
MLYDIHLLHVAVVVGDFGCFFKYTSVEICFVALEILVASFNSLQNSISSFLAFKVSSFDFEFWLKS